MQQLDGFFVRTGRLDRSDVGLDRFLPMADARVDVRWHVLRMRGGRRHLGVAVGSIETLRGGLRIVIEVDQVVRYARMLRETPRDRFEDRRALCLLGIGLV